MPLDAGALDRLAARGCQAPGCEHNHDEQSLILAQKCHPGRGTLASYRRGTGVVAITCEVCGQLVVEIKAARPLGATGEYPAGIDLLAPTDDLGGLTAALSADLVARRVRIDFGKMLRWVSMTRGEAFTFAEQLRYQGAKLKE